MQTEAITLDRAKARDLYRAYKKHKHYSEPIDDEIRRAYQLLAQGRLIIKALESIKAAGLGDDGFPKLALCRADRSSCQVSIYHNGSSDMSADGARTGKVGSLLFHFPADTFPRSRAKWNGRALLPPVPLHLRPKRGLANYHILWEAEWQPVPPRDPFLLRRIGKADMWLVVAMWDLTEVERAALAARLNG